MPLNLTLENVSYLFHMNKFRFLLEKQKDSFSDKHNFQFKFDYLRKFCFPNANILRLSTNSSLNTFGCFVVLIFLFTSCLQRSIYVAECCFYRSTRKIASHRYMGSHHTEAENVWAFKLDMGYYV